MKNNSVYSLKDALMGGPGLDGYAYNADIYCVDCGREIVREVFDGKDCIGEVEFFDSEKMPQPIFFGESECEEHCGNCGVYMYGEGRENETT